MIIFERSGDFAIARLTQKLEDCPDCGGTGLVRTTVKTNGREYEVVGACATRKMESLVHLFNSAQIPGRHAQTTLDSYKPGTPEQQRALFVARDFSFRYVAERDVDQRKDVSIQRGYILSGPVGTGKTHLLAATLRHLTIERKVASAYVEISHLYSQIRRGFQEGRSGGEIIGPLSRIEVLAIDELGKGRGSQFELETLDELISRRYNSGKVTLFATNYSLTQPEHSKIRGYFSTDSVLEATRDSKLLCDRVGDRIYSRLWEMCEFVELPTSGDKRRALAAGRHAS